MSLKVPKEVRQRLTEEAEEEGYPNRQKYLISMINAGRREFGLGDESKSDQVERSVPDLKSKVYANLDSTSAIEWEELIDTITLRLEEDIEEVVDELIDEEKVEITPRGGIKKIN